MKLPRDISGQELVAALCKRWGYRRTHQVGSHILLETDVPSHHRISIPAHRHVAVGTLGNIIRAVADHKGVSKQAVLESLF